MVLAAILNIGCKTGQTRYTHIPPREELRSSSPPVHFEHGVPNDVKGALNFKIENKELLDSVLQTLADKAKLQQRGDAYYRPKAVPPPTTN